MQRYLKSLSWLRNESGSTATLFALTITIILGMVGMAVDGSRWYSARRAHATAIDAALLAGARILQVSPSNTSGAATAAVSFYNANLPQGLKFASNTIKFQSTQDGVIFTFTGSASINSTFLNVIGIKTLPVEMPASAQIGQNGGNQGSNIEIALMLDITGSMCDDGTGPCTSGTKISGLKTAATDLASIVLGQQSGTYTSRIALVPFSSAVRIDDDGTSNPLMGMLTGVPPAWTGYQAQNVCTGGSGYNNGEFWVQASPGTCGPVTSQYVKNLKQIPCVTERTFSNGIGFDPSDSAPNANNWLLGHGGDRFPLDWDSTSSTPFTYVPAKGNSGQQSDDPTWQWDYSSDGSGCTVQPGNNIMPLTSKLPDITKRLSTLNAYGPTAGALGVTWTQYMLSPNWGNIWTGGSKPGSYADAQTKQANGSPLLRKVAVLMTDGGFNTFRQGAADNTTQMQIVSNFALQVCTNMKNNGIEVYTVGFNLNALPAAEATIANTTLMACGSDVSHFYSSLTVADLDSAFKDIALKVNPIRLSQ